MDVGSVSTEMVRASPEGLEHWACLGLDLGARGAAGQALNRALEKQPYYKHEVYKWLGEDLKKMFRTSWAIERSFERVVKQRTRTLRNLGYPVILCFRVSLKVGILWQSTFLSVLSSLGT